MRLREVSREELLEEYPMAKTPRGWPSHWQRFWFRLFNRWMIRNGFLTGYEGPDGKPIEPY